MQKKMKNIFPKNQDRQKINKNNISGPQNSENIKSFRKLIYFKPGTSQEDHL